MFKDMVMAIRNAGGEAYKVGGAVRDHLLGLPSKDMDIEVYGLDEDKLIALLRPFGEVNTVGKSFGVVKVRTADGMDYDFSLPSFEVTLPSDSGANKHKDVKRVLDPYMSPKDACARRDFTINAMMMDPFTNEIYDFYGGQKDIDLKRLRATSELFRQDTLRVLRGVQLAARFNMRMDRATAQTCQDIRWMSTALTSDRIMTEMLKLAMGNYPREGLMTLLDTGWNKVFPSIRAISENGFLYPRMVDMIQFPAHARKSNLTNDERVVAFYAALMHNSPEMTTLPDEIFLPIDMKQKIKVILDAPYPIVPNSSSVKKLAAALHTKSREPRVTIREYLAVMRTVRPLNLNSVNLIEELAKTNWVFHHKERALMSGSDLMEMCIPVGKSFGTLLEKAYEAQMNGEFSNHEQGYYWLESNKPTAL